MISKLISNNFRLENWVLAVVFLLPVYLVRFSGTNLLDILIVIAFLWWMFLEKKKRALTTRIIVQNKLFFIGLALIIAGLAAGLVKTHDLASSLGIIKSWFVLPFILAFLFKVSVPDEKKWRLYQVVFCSAFIVAVISVVFSFVYGLTYDGRMAGIFNSPNYLFMYLAPGILSGTILIRRFLGGRMTEKAILHGAVLLLIFVVTVLTRSYAGILTLAVAEIFILRNIFNKKTTLLAVLAVVLTFLVFIEKNSEKFRDTVGFSERSSVASRVMIWESGWKILEDNWFWGIGEADFQAKYLEYQKFFPPYLEWAVPHPHNIFLAFWLSTGLFGLAGLIILLFNWLRMMMRKEKKLLWGASAIILYFVLHGFFDTTYFKNDLACLFWLAYSFFLKLDPPDLSVVPVHEE